MLIRKRFEVFVYRPALKSKNSTPLTLLKVGIEHFSPSEIAYSGVWILVCRDDTKSHHRQQLGVGRALPCCNDDKFHTNVFLLNSPRIQLKYNNKLSSYCDNLYWDTASSSSPNTVIRVKSSLYISM